MPNAVSAMWEMLPDQVILTCTTCDQKEKKKKKRGKTGETTKKPDHKYSKNPVHVSVTSLNTSIAQPEVYKADFTHLHPKHPLGPKSSVFPVIQLPPAGSYISNRLCYWTISVKQYSGRV